MYMSKWTYLFISLFVSAISYTHILPTDKKLIKIVYSSETEESFFEAVKEGFRKKYNDVNDPAVYKPFDEVFEIKNVSKEEFDVSSEDETKNIVCVYSDTASRLEDFRYDPTKSKIDKKTITNANYHPILTAFDLAQFKLSGNPSNDSEKYKDKYSVFKILNEQAGKLKIMHFGAMITDIKEERPDKKLEDERPKLKKTDAIISWKQAGLLTSGVTVVALGAYLMIRYNNQKSTQSSSSLNTDKNSVCTTATHLLPADNIQLLIKK